MSNAEKIYKTQGIILRHYPFGETDYILSLLTPNRGKVRAIVKGARKLKSRIGGHVEPVMLTSFLLTKGHNLDLVNQAE
ncbi:DNA repair protein RecO, partial [Dehalococcoidia bacterium]|nr:DNA repair protein RecO [Dehalococcoidia bacterium]